MGQGREHIFEECRALAPCQSLTLLTDCCEGKHSAMCSLLPHSRAESVEGTAESSRKAGLPDPCCSLKPGLPLSTVLGSGGCLLAVLCANVEFPC